MTEHEWLAERFQDHRQHLRAVAYRMLGSLSDADDAVQEAWIRLSKADTREVDNLRAWLTTVVARVCLNLLERRKTRREDSLEVRVPDPIILGGNGDDPEHLAVVADSVGLALLVVLDSLKPVERLAFVLHDVFAVPFEDIATIVDRSPAATRQLASRARRKVRSARAADDYCRDNQQRVVDAFLAAARDGNFERLLTILDPDVVLRVDGGSRQGSLSRLVHGAAEVAGQALLFANLIPHGRRATVNDGAGVVTVVNGKVLYVIGFTVAGDRIVEIDILADPDRLSRLDFGDVVI